MIRFVKDGSIKYIVIASVCLSIGNYFRSVGTIVLIAAVFYILLQVKKTGVKKAITSFCILGVLFNIPNWNQNFILQETNIVNESVNKNSAPIYMWINMGMNEDTIGYWDNMKSYNIYQRQARYNKEKSTELFKEEIKINYQIWVSLVYQKCIMTRLYGLGQKGHTKLKPLALVMKQLAHLRELEEKKKYIAIILLRLNYLKEIRSIEVDYFGFCT